MITKTNDTYKTGKIQKNFFQKLKSTTKWVKKIQKELKKFFSDIILKVLFFFYLVFIFFFVVNKWELLRVIHSWN